MSSRFQIQEMIAQDATGVVFQALDSQTGRTVALRRFFPFGPGGGGLQAEEETAYLIAINRLAELSHPCLRSVIGGGCDPVDRMPYIVTEWVEGESLSRFVQSEALPVSSAVQLLKQVLEVSGLVSQVFAEEAVWVETDLQTIVVGTETSGRGFTFWISPIKWLGNGRGRGFGSLIKLTEEILGWQGRPVSDRAGGGLGAWLRWLRGAVDTASLSEVREKLSASLCVVPPRLLRKPAPKASRPPASLKSRTPLLLALVFSLTTLGVVIGFLHHKRKVEASPTPPVAEVMIEDDVSSLPPIPPPTQVAEPENALATSGGVFTPKDGRLMVEKKGSTGTLEGMPVGIEMSRSSKTLYLYFSAQPADTEPRVAVRFSGVTQAMGSKWLGEKIRVTGKIDVRGQRPEILVRDAKSIEVID